MTDNLTTLIENAKPEHGRDLPRSRRRIFEQCAGWDGSGAEAQCHTRTLLARFLPLPSGQEMIKARFVKPLYQTSQYVNFQQYNRLKILRNAQDVHRSEYLLSVHIMPVSGVKEYVSSSRKIYL